VSFRLKHITELMAVEFEVEVVYEWEFGDILLRVGTMGKLVRKF
jgi:hypothetical protein